MKWACKCGASFTTEARQLAHFAWADSLPVLRVRLDHNTAADRQAVL